MFCFRPPENLGCVMRAAQIKRAARKWAARIGLTQPKRIFKTYDVKLTSKLRFINNFDNF